jgi:ATP-binding cassette, subfamily B, bacterial
MIPRLLAPQRRIALAQLAALAVVEATAMTGVALALKSATEGVASGVIEWPPVALLSILGVLAATLGWERVVATADFGMRYANELRANLARHAIALASVNKRRRLGTMAMRMTGDLNALRDWAATGLSDLAASAGACLAAIAILASVLGGFGLAIVLGAVVLNGLLALVMFSQLSRAARDVRRTRGRVSALAGDIVLGAAAIDTFRGGRREGRRLKKRSEQLREATVRSRRIAAMLAAPAAATTALATVVTLLLSGQGLSGMQTPGDWASFMFGLGFLAAGLAGGTRAVDGYVAYAVARHRVQHLAAQIVRPGKAPSHAPASASVGGVQGLELPASSTIHKPGEVVTIAAGGDPSDAYKRVLELARSGAGVKLNGEPLCRRNLAIVSPAVPLLRGSVRRNLTLGRKGATESEVVSAMKLANLDTAVWSLESVIDPALELSDPWTSACLRLARAIAHKPRVILVAEPTFMVDRIVVTDYERIAAETGAILIVAVARGPAAILPLRGTAHTAA